MFSININDISFQKAPLKSESYKAYKKVETSYKNEAGETKTKTSYSKTSTNLYTHSERASINLEYKLISTIDRSILVNKVVADQLTDQVKYMSYKGDYKQLIPGYWEYKTKEHISDKIRDNSSSNRELQSYFNSRKTLKSQTTLYNNLLNNMSTSIIQPIAAYDPN